MGKFQQHFPLPNGGFDMVRRNFQTGKNGEEEKLMDNLWKSDMK